MRDHTFFMQKAIEIAKTAQGFNNKNKTGAIIVYKDRIIASGSNSPKTHPLARTYSKHPEAIYLHAEIDAIIKASRSLTSTEFKHSSIYIARVRRDNTCGISKPCNGCTAAIAHFNFAIVGFSLDAAQGLSYSVYDRKGNK
jgi:tRNA(Arg) A34 adenosine deaminase TadA